MASVVLDADFLHTQVCEVELDGVYSARDFREYNNDAKTPYFSEIRSPKWKSVSPSSVISKFSLSALTLRNCDTADQIIDAL
jgi:hypothetical protein